jgi:hypothetical protein
MISSISSSPASTSAASTRGVAASVHVIHDVRALLVVEHPVGTEHSVKQVVGGVGGGAGEHVWDADAA